MHRVLRRFEIERAVHRHEGEEKKEGRKVHAIGPDVDHRLGNFETQTTVSDRTASEHEMALCRHTSRLGYVKERMEKIEKP